MSSRSLSGILVDNAKVDTIVNSDAESEFANTKDPLSILLPKLGEPPESVGNNPANDLGLPKRAGRHRETNDANSSACRIFMTDFESRPGYLDAVEYVRDRMIFYCSELCSGPDASLHHEIFFFVARRVTSETDPSALLYYMLMELQKFVNSVLQGKETEKESPIIDIVIDSSSFITDSALPMWSYTSFWGNLKSLIGNSFGKYVNKIYVIYPSAVLLMTTQQILKKWGLKIKFVMEKVEVCTPTQLISKYPSLMEKVPQSTYCIEVTSLKHWPALFKGQAVMITISSSQLLLQSQEKIGGVAFTRTDMLQLHLIESIFRGSSSSSLKSKKQGKSGGSYEKRKKFPLPSTKGGLSLGENKKEALKKERAESLVVINYAAFHSKRPLKLYFTYPTEFMSALRQVLRHKNCLLYDSYMHYL